jgi:hypothetical protein
MAENTRGRSSLLFVCEIVGAVAMCGGLGGDYLFRSIDSALAPDYGTFEWYPDFLSILRLLIWSVTGGLAVVAVVHFRHRKYDHPGTGNT